MLEYLVSLMLLTAPTAAAVDTPVRAEPMPQLAAVSTAPTASSRISRHHSCVRVLRSKPVPMYGRWRVSCVDKINVRGLTRPGVEGRGLTDHRNRAIYLKATGSPAAMQRTYAHELGHAYSIDVLTNRQRAYFAKRVGKKNFWDARGYIERPTEIWAASQAKCNGFPTRGYKVVPCQVLVQTVMSPR